MMKSIFTTEKDNSSIEIPRRRFVKIFPTLLVCSLGSLFLIVAWDHIFPPITLDVVRVRVKTTQVAHATSQRLFQAAGWIKADPYLHEVPALVSGYIKNIYVTDGQSVKKGDLLAELIDEDYIIAASVAKNELDELYAHLKHHELKIQEQDANIEWNNAKQNTETKVAETLLFKLNSFKKISAEHMGGFDIEEAKLKYEEQLEKIKEFDAEKKLLLNNKEQLKHNFHALQSKTKSAELNYEQKKLDLSRTKIYAPSNGIIAKMYARVGRKQMAGSDNAYSTTIASLFDPHQLQVQVDVPFSDISKVEVGQKCKIQIEAITKPLIGEVLSTGGMADYQKNTLEVKVKIFEHQALIRPEMLAQVEFQGVSNAKDDSLTDSKMLYLKKEAIQNNSYVWVLDVDNRAKKRLIQIGRDEIDGWVSITKGLFAGEKVIMNPTHSIKDNIKIKIGALYE